MPDLKDAVKIATDYLGQLYDPKQLGDVLLEEVDVSEDGRYWLITLGFSRLTTTPPEAGPLIALVGTKVKREYKMFQVDKATGQVLSMRIRNV